MKLRSFFTVLGAALLTAAAAAAQDTTAAPPAEKAAPPIAARWTDALEKHPAEVGQELAFTCPPEGSPVPGTVWGTEVYTSDSAICAAAVHAGRITAEEGGTVVVRVLAGRDFYHGTPSHGVESQDYGDGWEMSFAFVERRGASYEEEEEVVTLGWTATAELLRPRQGKRLSFRCPPGGKPAGVWGTKVYTDDSSICTAAVHAGRITLAEGGLVTLKVRGGRDAYRGSEQHGVRSGDNGPYPGSFSFH